MIHFHFVRKKLGLEITWTPKYNEPMKIDNTISLISRVRENLNRMLVNEMEALGMDGLVPSHGDILVELFKHGEMSKSQIADNISRDRSTVTTLVNKLIKFGYVETRKNPEDSRSVLVFLTAKGADLKSGIMEISENIFETLYADINDEERRIFRKVLMKMEQNTK